MRTNEPTLAEIFEQIFCICGHPLDPNDENGHEDDRCWGADENGITYYACKCRKIRPIPFSIPVEIFDADINESSTNN